MNAFDRTTVAAASTKPALAHVCRKHDGSFDVHSLEDHLRAVGDRAEEEPR